MPKRDMSGLLDFNDDLGELRSGDGLDGIIQRRAPDQIVVGTEAELSPDELVELEECETIIDRGIRAFFEAGQALARVRDLRLYRVEHPTFEAYCQQRWGMERAHAYRMVDSAAVYENLSPMGDILPANERQARPLARLEPDQQREAWEQARLTAPNGRITGAHVERIVSQLYPPPATCSVHVNEQATLRQENDWAHEKYQTLRQLLQHNQPTRAEARRRAAELRTSPLATHVHSLADTLDEIAAILGIDT